MKRVLIIRPGALGDTLMIVPALKDLAGKVSTTFVGRQPGLDLIRPYVDRAMDLEGSGWHRLFQDAPHDNPLPVSGMDIVAAFFSKEEEAIRRNLEQLLPGAAIHLFRSFPPEGEPVHVALYLARCLEAAGLPVDPIRSVSAVNRGSLCRNRTSSEREKRIVLHPGSGSRKKNYPPAFWVELAGRLSRDPLFREFKQVLLLGPAEASLRPYFSENLQTVDPAIVTSWDPDLLRKSLDGAALYVGHDSGVTHLSAMRCIPTIALFRKSDPVQWAPLGPFVRVIEAVDPGPGLVERIVEGSKGCLGGQP